MTMQSFPGDMGVAEYNAEYYYSVVPFALAEYTKSKTWQEKFRCWK